MRTPKILVEITELNDKVHFKKCPINEAGQVEIYTRGGRGKKAETPQIPEVMFTQSKWFGLVTKRYARYRRGSNRFMVKDDPVIPPISFALIQTWINNDTFNSFFGNKNIQFIFYLILAGVGISILLGVLPYVR